MDDIFWYSYYDIKRDTYSNDGIIEKVVRIYEDTDISFYTANSITLCRIEDDTDIKITLRYTYYDKKHMKLILLKGKTHIATSQPVRFEKYEDIENELMRFGNNLAKYLGLKFYSIIFDTRCYNIKYRCYDCGSTLQVEPFTKKYLSLAQTDTSKLKISSNDVPEIACIEKQLHNTSVTKTVNYYIKKIEDNVYCETCISKFRKGYIESLAKCKQSIVEKYREK